MAPLKAIVNELLLHRGYQLSIQFYLTRVVGKVNCIKKSYLTLASALPTLVMLLLSLLLQRRFDDTDLSLFVASAMILCVSVLAAKVA